MVVKSGSLIISLDNTMVFLVVYVGKRKISKKIALQKVRYICIKHTHKPQCKGLSYTTFINKYIFECFPETHFKIFL